MDPLVLAVLAVLVVSGFLASYKLKSPVPAPAAKPSFCALPKFSDTLTIPSAIAEATEPVDELASRLARFGFSQVARDNSEVVFSRGSALGDFSLRIAKVNLRVFLPLASSAPYIIEYGSFAAFDTGDLWQFAQELKSHLALAA